MRIVSLAFAAALAASLAACGSTPVAPPTAAVGASQYYATMAHYAEANGVPVEIGNAVVTLESRYNPSVTGSAGEIGLMQIKYETARSLGYTGSRQGLYDPETNLQYGMIYLGQAYRAGGGTVCGTMLKYMGGLRATQHSDWTRTACARAEAMIG